MLYEVSDSYIAYLRTKYDPRVLDNHLVKHNRKYVGLKMQLNGYDYFLPLSSPDKVDYFADGTVRKTIIPIFRMFQSDGNFLGKILLNNMIPVPSSELTYYDVSKETDQKYRLLVLDELRVIKRDFATIQKNASILYKQKAAETADSKIGYLKATVDFKKLEDAYDRYMGN